MSQLVYNSSYQSTQLPTNLDGFFEYFINLEKPCSAILILPTGKFVKWAKKRFCRLYFNTKQLPTPPLHFFRLNDFAKKCLQELAPTTKFHFLSEAGVLSLMEDAIRKIEISYFKKKDGSVSYNVLQKITDIIIGLKEDGILPDSMTDELTARQNILTADIRFEEISKIYFQYNKLLSDKYLDETSVYYKILELIEENPNGLNNLSFYKNESLIFFSGFTEFKLPEAKFVSQFTNCRIPTLINIDYCSLSGPQIQSLPDNVRRLVKEGHNQQIKIGDNKSGLISEFIRQ